jgi:hypothetical protein
VQQKMQRQLPQVLRLELLVVIQPHFSTTNVICQSNPTK